MGDTNGKWQLAFWLISVICGAWLLSLTAGVVANEVRNVTEHKDIRQELYAQTDAQYKRIQDKLEVVLQDISCIKAKLNIN